MTTHYTLSVKLSTGDFLKWESGTAKTKQWCGFDGTNNFFQKLVDRIIENPGDAISRGIDATEAR
jgi:hypothetical protein